MGPWLPNAYAIEIVQCLFSTGAFLLLLWALADVVKDAMFLPQKERWGRRGTMAVGHVHQAFFRLCLGVILGVLGFSGILLPPPPVSPELRRALLDSPEIRLSVLITRGGLIAASMVVLLDALVARIFRVRHVRRLKYDMEDKAAPIANDRRHPPPLGERLS